VPIAYASDSVDTDVENYGALLSEDKEEVPPGRGSIYISNYLAGMTTGSYGSVSVSYQITGVSTMDEIGSPKIEIYENGTLVKTYLYTNTTGMMSYNKIIHSGVITYSGTAGKKYYAYVTFKAGKNGGWDNRTLATNTVTAN